MNWEPVLYTVGVVIVLCAIMLSVDRCSTRNQEFRVSCVTAGGTLIDNGAQSTCVSGTGAVRRSN